MDRTLAIIKPDGVLRGLVGEVIKRLEANNFKIIAMKMLHLSKYQAESFYIVHKDRLFFNSLTNFMASGAIIVMVLKGDNAIGKYRELMGATDYRTAAKGTIRYDFATSIEKNIVHGSDSVNSAIFEIKYFFGELEILD